MIGGANPVREVDDGTVSGERSVANRPPTSTSGAFATDLDGRRADTGGPTG